MARIGLFTIASKNYLSYVRVLLKSVAQAHPEYRLFLCLADRVDGQFDAGREPFETVETERLGIPAFADMALRYDIMEFNTAVKPFMFRWLFDNTDLDAIIYLDPDIRAYSRFERLDGMLREGASAVLTPHITQPLEDGKLPDDRIMLQAGVFNLGFIALGRTPESLRFVDWWGRRLRTQCLSEPRNNLFVDQKWCDLAPCFIDDLRILKDPGYNVAYWNLAHRRATRRPGGGLDVNGSPLAFFHFSGVSASSRKTVSKHQDRFAWNDIPGYQDLFESYFDELLAAGWDSTRTWPYAYGTAGDLVLHATIRQLYRSLHPEPAAPPRDGLREFLVSMCNKPAPDCPDDGEFRVTALMLFIHGLRQDLQLAFALRVAEDRRRFCVWFEEAGPREYGFPPSLTRQAVIRNLALAEQPAAAAAPSFYRALMRLERHVLNPLWRRLPAPLKPPAARAFARISAWAMRRH